MTRPLEFEGLAQALREGPPAHWIEALTGFALELDFDAFVLWPRDDDPAQLERFAREVVPGVRENLAST